MRFCTGSSSWVPYRFVISARVAESKEICKQALGELGWSHIKESGNKVLGAPSSGRHIFEKAFDLLSYRTENLVTFEFETLPESETLILFSFKSSQRSEKANVLANRLLELIEKVAIHLGTVANFKHPAAIEFYKRMAQGWPHIDWPHFPATKR